MYDSHVIYILSCAAFRRDREEVIAGGNTLQWQMYIKGDSPIAGHRIAGSARYHLLALGIVG